MQLYGGYFQTQFKDQFGVLSQEMYKYLKQQNRKMERKQTELEAEIFACRTLIDQLMKTNDRLHAENGQKAAKIEDLQKELARQKKTLEEKFQLDLDIMQENFKNKWNQLKQYFEIEVNVSNTIRDSLVETNKWQSQKLRKFALLLRIPRLHFDYIEKHGVNKFVDFCEDIVKRERTMAQMLKADRARVDLRNDYTVF